MGLLLAVATENAASQQAFHALSGEVGTIRIAQLGLDSRVRMGRGSQGLCSLCSAPFIVSAASSAKSVTTSVAIASLVTKLWHLPDPWPFTGKKML
jgi:hypothetical protein